MLYKITKGNNIFELHERFKIRGRYYWTVLKNGKKTMITIGGKARYLAPESRLGEFGF